MKRIFLFLLAALFLVQCAYALTIPFTDITILEPAEPVLNESNPVLVEPTLDIQIGIANESVVDTISRTVGIGQIAKRNLTITYEGKMLGIIPEDAPFAGFTLHDSCLTPFQPYGTIDWYNCEVAIQ